MGMMAIVLQDKKISDEFIAIYQEMLADIPDDVLIKAMKDCLLTCRFFPSIAEIREKAELHLNHLRLQASLDSYPKIEDCRPHIKQSGRLKAYCDNSSGCSWAYQAGRCHHFQLQCEIVQAGLDKEQQSRSVI